MAMNKGLEDRIEELWMAVAPESAKQRLEDLRQAKVDADAAQLASHLELQKAEARLKEATAREGELDAREKALTEAEEVCRERERRSAQFLEEAETRAKRAKRDEGRAKVAREQLAKIAAEGLAFTEE